MRIGLIASMFLILPLLPTWKPCTSKQGVRQYQRTQHAKAYKGDNADPCAFDAQRPYGTQIDKETNNQKKVSRANPVQNGLVGFINSISTGVIAFFAIVTAILVWIQIKTVKGIERPWAVVWIEQEPFQAAVEQRFSEITIIVTCRNFGRTPVWIESAGVRTWTGPEKEFKPQWDTEWIQQAATVLAPNSRDSSMQMVSTISYQDYAQIIAGIRSGFVYGIITYRDATETSHMTRFCYKYKVVGTVAGKAIGGFYAEGPEGYNKRT